MTPTLSTVEEIYTVPVQHRLLHRQLEENENCEGKICNKAGNPLNRRKQVCHNMQLVQTRKDYKLSTLSQFLLQLINCPSLLTFPPCTPFLGSFFPLHTQILCRNLLRINPALCITIWTLKMLLVKLHQHVKFGYKRLSSSEYVGQSFFLFFLISVGPQCDQSWKEQPKCCCYCTYMTVFLT